MEDNTEFAMQDAEPTVKNAATRNVDDRSSRTQQTGIALDSPDVACSQPPPELLQGSQNGDVEHIGPSSRKKKKKKKKKKAESADGAISSTVDEDVQDSTPSSAVYSDRESSVSTTAVYEAGQQSTHLPTPIESENEDATQCSQLPKKKKKNKKKKKKKTETTDSNLQGDDSKNAHYFSSDGATAIPMDAPVLADDGNEGLRDELQNEDAITERTDNREDSVMRKEISTTLTPSEVTHSSEVPNEMGSLETNSSAENLDEIQDAEPTDNNAATRNVDDRSSRTQQTGVAVDSPDVACSQPPPELLERFQNGDVEHIGPSSRKKKKKKKKNAESADGAISSTVDEDFQDSTPSSAVYSDRESSVSTTTVYEAGQQSTHLPTPIESENEDATQCSQLPKKKKKNKKKKKKKTETTDSNLQGDDSKNAHYFSSDGATAIPMDAPVLADDGNEGLRDELQNNDALRERTENQEDSVMRKEISARLTPSEVTHSSVVPNEMGSLETNSSAENLDEIQEEGKRSAATSILEKSRESKVPHAPDSEPRASLTAVTSSNGINTNPHENIEAAEKEEPESYNDNNSSDLLGDFEG